MKYVGLTADPKARKQEHGNPEDWWMRFFSNEREARIWLKEKVTKIGYRGGPVSAGWMFGYIYTITFLTNE